MLEYVRICPKCAQENPETSHKCCGQDCGEYLRGVEPMPRPKTAWETPSQKPESFEVQTDIATGSLNDVPPENVRLAKRFDAASALYLDLVGTMQIYPIQKGEILGRADPTSTADIQLAGIQGVNYIHRRHCFFDYEGGCWYVTAIMGDKFSNPTFVNNFKLQPGQRHPIRNGDRLTLCDITFDVRIIPI